MNIIGDNIIISNSSNSTIYLVLRTTFYTYKSLLKTNDYSFKASVKVCVYLVD